MRPLAILPLLLIALPAAGFAATGDWRGDAPGRRHAIDPTSLPAPYATPAAGNPPTLVDRPAGAMPQVPAGFSVTPFAELRGARRMQVAPDGSVFVTATDTGRVVVLATRNGGGRALGQHVFATGLRQPYGIAFWPADHPAYVYIGEVNRIVRYKWHTGATAPDGPAETVMAGIRTSDHFTRDVVVSPDGKRLLIAIGSGSNDADGMEPPPPGFIASHAPGAAWGAELNRANVLSIAPDGSDVQVMATGLRNCAGATIEPATGALWCATNERDGLGDDLPPDYLTRVQPGGFYGWPWFYIGNHPDPDHGRERPDLAGRAIVPSILVQPHSAPLGIAFYTGAMFPAEWHGRGFAALHGSWDRATRAGYKVVSFDPATNAYTDFMTGFVAGDDAVWGRPVGVTVAHDGALLVSDDGGGVIWRVAH